MCTGLDAMKMWIRERRAPASASALASMSSLRVRQSEATVGWVTAAATALTPSKSPGEETANPASITSTPSRSSCWAISAFSSGRSAMPGDCSPSRNVVSKIVILRVATAFPPSPPTVRRRTSGVESVGVCAYTARGLFSPLAGENAEEDHEEAARRRLGRKFDAGCMRRPHRKCRQVW